MALGMAYLAFDVAPGTADGIARFYREVMGAAVVVEPNGAGRKAKIHVGDKQQHGRDEAKWRWID